jgi:hypothetical protein
MKQILSIKTTLNKKTYELQSFITFGDLQLLFWLFLHLRSFSTTAHSLVILEHMDSFDI